MARATTRSAKAKPPADANSATRKFVAAVQVAERIIIDKFGDPLTPYGIEIWISSMLRLAVQFGIETPKMQTNMTPEQTHDLLRSWISTLEVEVLIDNEVRNLDRNLVFNDDWKAKATTYVAHIREVVGKATMIEGLRERILSRLNDLQVEIDRNRTRVESITEVFLSLTEAAGKGAKNLNPAIRLLERLAGAFSGARTALLGLDPQLLLPPPESLGMVEPSVQFEDADAENHC
jgi:hypothetical protein